MITGSASSRPRSRTLDDFSESDLPWKVDVVDWAVTSESFRRTIERDKVLVQESIDMSDWHETTLGKICEKQGGSVQTGPFGSQLHASDYTVVGTPVVMPMNLVDGNIDDQGIARISDKNVSRLAKHKLVRGDIVFSRRGDVTRFALVSDREAGWLCGTGCLKISIGNPTIATPDFIATVLASPNSKEWLIRHAVGATMPNLNTAILENVPITLLPIEEQRAIAHILGTLDDKIELNRRMNLTLEAMARALFKSWFVDFEPVRAKAEDRDPGLPNEIADLFPSRLVDSALGEIPEGWEIAPVSKLIDFNPNEPLRKGELAPYLDMASLPTAGSWPKAPIIRPFGSGMRFRNGDTLLARITPCLENGKTAFIQCLPDGVVGWGSTEYIVMRPKPPVPPEFAYLLARHPAFREQAIKSMTGTSGRQRAQGESVAAFKLVAPTGEKLWHAFARFVVPVFQNIKSHSETSLTLAVLRDTLLRRLISGEMRVNGLIKEVRP